MMMKRKIDRLIEREEKKKNRLRYITPS